MLRRPSLSSPTNRITDVPSNSPSSSSSRFGSWGRRLHSCASRARDTRWGPTGDRNPGSSGSADSSPGSTITLSLPDLRPRTGRQFTLGISGPKISRDLEERYPLEQRPDDVHKKTTRSLTDPSHEQVTGDRATSGVRAGGSIPQC